MEEIDSKALSVAQRNFKNQRPAPVVIIPELQERLPRCLCGC